MSRPKLWRLCASITLSFVLLQSTLAVPPQTAAANLKGVSFLQKSLGAMVGNASISDVTLTGTARRIAGSDDETGTASLKAVSNGSAHITLNLPSGTSAETTNLFSAPTGTWSGPDAIAHAVAHHNLFTEPAWFCPGIAIARRMQSADFVSTYVGRENLNGQTVEHLIVFQTSLLPDPPGGPSISHLSQIDLFLDSSTFLPAALSFNIHPDNDASLDLPVQILFSDYRIVSGVQTPFHVQRFLNNALTVDLQFQSVSINSGLSAISFSL